MDEETAAGDPEQDEAEAPEGAAGAKGSWLDAAPWLKRLLAPPAGPSSSKQVYRIDSRERMAGYAAAVVAAAAFCAIWVPQLHEVVHVTKGKTTLSPETSFAVGLVMSAALAGATAVGRRALLGFVALLVGLGGPWNSLFVAQIPFLALAGWLLMRASRISSEARKAAQAGKADAHRGSGSTPASRRKGERESGTRRPPEASKRYTPPKEARKQPRRRLAQRPSK